MKTKGLVMSFMFVVTLAACAPTAKSWPTIPGGEDITEDASWLCSSWNTVEDGAVTIGTGDEFRAFVNTYGPRLVVEGDFSVAATLSVASDNLAVFSLVGKLGASDWWDGTSRLDVGLDKGQVIVNYYNGKSFLPSVSQTFAAEQVLDGEVKLELRRVGQEFIVLANDKEVGRMEAIDAFPDGYAYFGASVRPHNAITLHTLTVSAPPGNTTVKMKSANASNYIPTDPPLRDLADARGIYIGGAVEPLHIRCDPTYSEVLGREFNLLVTENAFKFSPIHPEPDRFDFSGSDAIVEFAEAHDMFVRGHVLVWHQSLPDWVENATMSESEWEAMLQNHITTLVSHYKGRVDVWDVVNEGVDDGGVSLRNTVWSEGVGPDYIDEAFIWAHEADPDALLFYNDYDAEGMGSKSDQVYALVSGMLERGIPIHGVGLQMHVAVNAAPKPEDVQRNIQRLRALGLQVHITELDIKLPINPAPDLYEEQAEMYSEFLDVCLTEDNCTAFVMWGFTDRYSWIPSSSPGYDEALIFDKEYNPKPAYFALRDTLVGTQSLGPKNFGANCNCAP